MSKDDSTAALPEAAGVSAAHDRALEVWAKAGPEPVDNADGLIGVITSQHFCNFTLWGLEDEARRRDVDDSHIATVKRGIDEWNQRRNDLIETIDEGLLALFPPPANSATQHSESAGMMIDRLSILALKVGNMSALAKGEGEVARECAGKLEVLRQQRDDLARCLDSLMADCMAGRRYYKVYRQFKAYNDPRLNPYLAGRD